MQNQLIGLTDQQIIQKAPSVFTEHAAPSVSERYLYIPSHVAVREMRSLGFEPVEVRETRKRQPDGRAFAMHEMRFRSSKHPVGAAELGQLIPEVSMVNSHDRTSPMAFNAGLHRLICTNGMRVMEAGMGFRVRHVGKRGMDLLLAGLADLNGNLGRTIDIAMDWSKISLSAEKQLAFAKHALDIRGTALQIEPELLLTARRYGDHGSDLWSVFNRVQENVTKGGIEGRTSTNRRGSLRAIKSVAADVDWNSKLWAAASSLAAEVKPVSISVPAVA